MWLKKKGWFLYDHQVETFNLIKQGCDVILHAPTGGGKTIGGFMPSIDDFINNNNWLKKYKFDNKLYDRFKQYFTMLDSVRGTDFVKTFKPSWT